MVPQGAKMEAPISPNGNREEIKGVGGRGRSPSDIGDLVQIEKNNKGKLSWVAPQPSHKIFVVPFVSTIGGLGWLWLPNKSGMHSRSTFQYQTMPELG